jgi:hypothetical protein
VAGVARCDLRRRHKKKGSGSGGKARERHPAFDKGQVIANCGALHLNWERLDLSGYLEGLDANNRAHDPDAKKQAREPTTDRRRLMAFHRAVTGKSDG